MTGNSCPLSTGAKGVKAICNTPTAFSSCFLNNFEFHNFRDEYSILDYPNLEEGSCSSNVVFHTLATAHES